MKISKRRFWRASVAGLVLALLLAPAAGAQEAGEVALRQAGEAGEIDATVGEALELVVFKTRGGDPAAGEALVWSLERPEDGRLEPIDDTTRGPGADQEAGSGRARLVPARAGLIGVRVQSPVQAGCTGDDCRWVAHRFQVRARAEASPTRGRDVAALVGGGVAVAALLASAGDGDPAPGAQLGIAGGDGQHGLANEPLPLPLSVVAYRDGRPAQGATVTWTATGGAQLSAAATTTSSSGSASVNVLSLGPAAGPVLVTATLDGDPPASVTFHLQADLAGLVLVSGDGQTVPVNTAAAQPLVVRTTRNGAPEAGVALQWQVVGGSLASADGASDAAGLAQAQVVAGPSPGPVQVQVSRVDSPQAMQVFTLDAVELRALETVSGDGQSGAQDAALPAPLVVRASNDGLAETGVTVLWSASGGATLSTGSSVSDGAGLASVDVLSLGFGLEPVVVTARRADNPAISTEFTLGIIPPTLALVSGGGQSGLAGSRAALPVRVRLLDGAGQSMAGQTVMWSVASGSAVLDAMASPTDAGGFAEIGFSYGSFPGPIQIEASAFSGGVSIVASASSQPPGALVAASGDGQSGEPGDPLPLPLVVQINDPSPDLSGVPITFQVVSGSATLAPQTVLTDAAGQAATQVTLGTTPGPVVVEATAPGGVVVPFNLLVNGTLVVTGVTAVSGDGQILVPGTPSAPLVIELSGNGAPLVGKTVFWSTTLGTLQSATTVTDADGRSSNTVTVAGAGTAVVTASVPTEDEFVGASFSFTLNAGLGDLPSLSVNEASVAEALDAACAVLAGGGSLTPGEQDLVEQCEALAQASNGDPGQVNEALGEMLPDVAQTQADASKAAAGAQFENINQRMMTLRSGAATGPVSFSGLGLVMTGGRLPLADLGALFAAAAPAGEPEPGADFGRWGVFVSGNIGRGEADPTRLTPRYDFDVEGLTAGVDYRFSDRLVAGMALGYTRQDTELAGGQGSVGTEGLSLSLYSTWYRENDWYFDGVLTLARNRFDHARRIQYVLPGQVVDQTAVADSDGTDLGSTLTFGRDAQWRGWTLGAYGRLAYTRQRFDAFEERVDTSLPGAGLALRVDSRTLTGLSSALGGKAAYAHSTDWGVLMPHLELEWVKEHGDDAEAFRGFFVDDPTRTPIRVLGDDLDSSYFRATLGLSLVMGQGRSGFVTYEQLLARSGLSQWGLTLGLRWEF